ncbi:MAG: hypothetical protein A2X61_10815 [Ignavibacteria bacterium GWB2_35_12]|nr:MAG: hypothetical protein A2X63_10995 [Ignavibacteria bacterium GWA2_35_8]OGU40302.1 MAG: hypothetical protein A2X61_10815 [Ignavibacteria bacterium GWB2_35_12]OGU93038.1 MAG: hypothetical protein A2220_15935 [Ignavibacteria bacterium RIFOXYA2_FULL_35_10]OGV24730.1 MAG: hypothetical protein A2475_14040 [Ignavibacteria bacterium RIFOXYC2_FULL_35_21]
MDKETIRARQEQIIELIKGFCEQKLDDEYFELSTKLIQKLGRKRNVPFVTGKLEIWAAAVVHAIGTINFLFDKSFEPYATVEEINKYFGTKGSTTTSKSRLIRDIFNMNYYDSEFSTKHIQDNSPLNKFVMYDGFIVPIDSLPDELQETIKQVRAEGGDVEIHVRK